MTKFYAALLGAFALVAAPALSGCETETQTEIESDGQTDTDTELGIDDGVEAEAAETGNEIEAGLDSAGAAIREGAVDGVNAVEDGAAAVGDAVDSNVDLGDNAENQ